MKLFFSCFVTWQVCYTAVILHISRTKLDVSYTVLAVLTKELYWHFKHWNYVVSFILLAVFIHSFIRAISIAPLKVHYYSEALPTQHGYCVGVLRQSATGSCKWRTCPRSLCGGKSGIRTHNPWDKMRRIYQWATTPHILLCEWLTVMLPYEMLACADKALRVSVTLVAFRWFFSAVCHVGNFFWFWITAERRKTFSMHQFYKHCYMDIKDWMLCNWC